MKDADDTAMLRGVFSLIFEGGDAKPGAAEMGDWARLDAS
eukprot:SAG11_NODE_1947_length_4015_cov_20.610827_2_plen_40_part_00